jgi:ABC-type glycerol-3-phosphate transport system substrate-binding protein
MLPGATDAGLFFKPAQMLSIGKSTKNPEAAAKVINFLLNSKEGGYAGTGARRAAEQSGGHLPDRGRASKPTIRRCPA